MNNQKVQYSYQFIVHKDIPLLEFLFAHLSSMSRNNVKNILKNRCVLVDGVCTTQFDYLLTNKNIVQITKTPQKVLKQDRNKKSYSLDILYEDDDFVVINKPSGLLSIATDKENEQTAYHYVTDYVRSKNKHNQIFIVHRLDKDTSGVLMFCKKKDLRDKLQDVWNDIVFKREYIAIVVGKMNKKSDTIKSYLAETKTHIVFSSKGKEGKLAITNYEVIKENKDYSLLRVNIDSGRKNQIRVHLNDIGHPIVGDEKYGDKSSPIHRLGLHASKLAFKNPVNEKVYKFEAKLPKEFNKIF